MQERFPSIGLVATAVDELREERREGLVPGVGALEERMDILTLRAVCELSEDNAAAAAEAAGDAADHFLLVEHASAGSAGFVSVPSAPSAPASKGFRTLG